MTNVIHNMPRHRSDRHVQPGLRAVHASVLPFPKSVASVRGDRASAASSDPANGLLPPRDAGAAPLDPVRILVVDDNPDMLEIYRKVLSGNGSTSFDPLDALDAVLFGDATTDEQVRCEQPCFRIDVVQNGRDGRTHVKQSVLDGRPYAVAFVDMRMPGGWDGLETIAQLWGVDPDIEVVICTAYSDYSWGEIVTRLGQSDRLLFLRKPFDAIEVLQLACALSDKWCRRQEQRESEVALHMHVEQSTRDLSTAIEERKHAEGILEQFFALSADVLCVLDGDGRFKQINPAVQQVLGYRPRELEGGLLADIVCDDSEATPRAWALDCDAPRRAERVVRTRTREGGYRWMEWNFSADGNAALWYGTGRDVTQRQEIELTRKRLAAVLEGTTDIVFFIDCDGRVLYLNRQGHELFGIPESGEIGRLIDDFHPAWARDVIRTRGLPTAERGGTWRGETAVIHRDGHEIPVSQVIEVHRTSAHEVEFFSTILHDISDRKAYEAQLHYQATHDALTGLPNRNLFMDRLAQAAANAKHLRGQFLVAFIDLDRFKWINDTLGHGVGDEVLRAVSARMSACLRDTDTLARIGGDEFAVVLDESDQTDASLAVIRRLVACVAEPIAVAGQAVRLTCSVGCSSFPEDGEDADALLRFADVAMYRAKQTGRNRTEIYNAPLSEHLEERIQVETALRRAIEHHEFELHYQPEVDLQSGRVTAVEALLRWQHPVFGQYSPAQFIPIAEDAGLIEPIGEWVLYQACSQAKQWQDAGLPPVRVAVNVSLRQLDHARLLVTVARCLAVTQLDASWLELELTESAAMADPEATFGLASELKAIGVSLAIDDFGTGYSNVHCLRQLPANKLKLAGSFIDDIVGDTSGRAILNTVITLGHQLGLKVLAEMAETETQVAVLTKLGCDEVQGHYFSRPLPADVCGQLLRVNGDEPFPVAPPGE